MGVMDEAQQFRGFSLRAALRVIDEDDDGLVDREHLVHAFATYFEFLTAEEHEILLEQFLLERGPGASSAKISLMECVWEFDQAFIISKGHVDAMQALMKHAHGHAAAGPTGAQNPLNSIRAYLQRKTEAGDTGVLRRIFNAFDPRRTGFITLRGFKSLLRDEVGLTEHTDAELDFLFRAVDRDGDDALTFREFELAVTGEDKQKYMTDMLNKLG